jgi:hypothetical protein
VRLAVPAPAVARAFLLGWRGHGQWTVDVDLAAFGPPVGVARTERGPG